MRNEKKEKREVTQIECNLPFIVLGLSNHS